MTGDALADLVQAQRTGAGRRRDPLQDFSGDEIARLLHITAREPDGSFDGFAGADPGKARIISSNWPEPEPLGSELPPVPAFDPELLPDSLRDWCEDIAERMQVPLDFPAAAAIGALGAACMRRVMIQPKRLDTGWIVVPIIWGGLIGEPGTKKTPTLGAIYKPLHNIQAAWKNAFEIANAAAEIASEEHELRMQAYREQFKSHAKGKGTEPSRPEAPAAAKPQRRWLIASDVTYEALSELLASNPAGVSIWRDELTAWLRAFERQGRESDRAFFLECWAGHNPFSSARIARGATDVAHCAVGVFGGFQPNLLRSYLHDVQQDDGLFQRFQLLVWPDYPQNGVYVDTAPNALAQRHATDIFERITAMDAESPLILRFAPDAQELFTEWLPALDIRVSNDDLPPMFRAHLAKYRSLMPALSLLLSLADGCLESVSLHHAQMAAAWCEFLEKHAKRVYAAQLSPEMAAAQTLSRKLKAGWHKVDGSFTLRDVYINGWGGLTTADETRAAVRILCEYEWMRKVDVPSGTGRPSEIYEINPRIAEVK